MKDVNILKLNEIDVDGSLNLLGDMEMYDETLNDFIEGIDRKKELLKKYKDAIDMPNYAIYAHSVKSDSRYLGFKKLHDIAYEHEMKAKSSDSAFILSDYDNLITAIDETVKIVNIYLNN